MNNNIIKQFLLTPAAGKRLIAKSILSIPDILESLKTKTIVIVAGTTNGYVAEEILNKIGQIDDFSKNCFIRGITLPPHYSVTDLGRLTNESKFPGDVIISNGKWRKGLTIFDVIDELTDEDVILKGANAVNIEQRLAGILIGHPKAGTISAIMQTVYGKRTKLYLPIGLEKRVFGNINELANKLNSTNASGLRLAPICGNIITELEAIKLLTGASADLIASGGVSGAEGSSWIAITGNKTQIKNAENIIDSLKKEPSQFIDKIKHL